MNKDKAVVYEVCDRCKATAKPITEHPDVQKLIAKMVVLQAELEEERAKVKLSKNSLSYCKEHKIIYIKTMPCPMCLKASNAKLVEALKLTYRKHVCGDANVSWGEVSQSLLDNLCEAMGDKAYQEWSESERRRRNEGKQKGRDETPPLMFRCP
jgi:hypothetical protein